MLGLSFLFDTSQNTEVFFTFKYCACCVYVFHLILKHIMLLN